MLNLLLPVVDPITLKFTSYKKRKFVHKSGDWHIAIQANVIRKNKAGSFDILVQRRTKSVDIGKGQYDQSLATQMIRSDLLNPKKALKRGLMEELGLKVYKSIEIKGKFYINKEYENQPDIKNREILKLFIVLIRPNEKLKINKRKISSTEWVEWNTFKNRICLEKESFTKTSQFYFLDNDIMKLMENVSINIIKNRSMTNKQAEGIILHINTPKITKSIYLNQDSIMRKRYLFV